MGFTGWLRLKLYLCFAVYRVSSVQTLLFISVASDCANIFFCDRKQAVSIGNKIEQLELE